MAGKITWDAWRERYPETTVMDERLFYSGVWAHYRNQHHYDSIAVRRAIADVHPATVVELGGWDGELAADMLAFERELLKPKRIERWTMVEICQEAAEVARTRDGRLEAPELPDWYWDHRWTADLFVASHVIEHLTATQLEATVQATDAPAMYFDAPIANGPTDWSGYQGTHILEVGWDGVDEICAGYEVAWSISHGGLGEARLYLET